MTPLAKYRACLLGFLATGFLFLGGMLYLHGWFVVPFFANVLLWSYALRRVECSECGAKLAPSVGSPFVDIFKSFRSKECGVCGAGLTLGRKQRPAGGSRPNRSFDTDRGVPPLRGVLLGAGYFHVAVIPIT